MDATDTPASQLCPTPSEPGLPAPFFRSLFEEFFADYLRITDAESTAHLRLDEARFLRPDCPDWSPLERDALGLVADVPGRRPGETVRVVIQVEPEPRGPAAISQQLGRYLVGLEASYGQPLLLSVVYLRRGRPGINLESAAVAKVFDMEVLRIFYTAFSLAETRAEYYLDRPEPLAWALAALMRPTRRSRAEHKLACLRRIAAAGLPEHRRLLLERCVEDWMELPPDDRAEYAALVCQPARRGGFGVP